LAALIWSITRLVIFGGDGRRLQPSPSDRRIERGADRGKHFLDVTNVCVFLLGRFGGERD
jgi:hypothetical protein